MELEESFSVLCIASYGHFWPTRVMLADTTCFTKGKKMSDKGLLSGRLIFILLVMLRLLEFTTVGVLIKV